jgi:hypothetical protein
MEVKTQIGHKPSISRSVAHMDMLSASIEKLHLHGVEVLVTKPSRPLEPWLHIRQRERRRYPHRCDRLFYRCALLRQTRAQLPTRGWQTR